MLCLLQEAAGGMVALLGLVVSTASLCLQAQQHSPTSPPLSKGNGAKPRTTWEARMPYPTHQQNRRQRGDPSASTTLCSPQGEVAGHGSVQQCQGLEMTVPE